MEQLKGALGFALDLERAIQMNVQTYPPIPEHSATWPRSRRPADWPQTLPTKRFARYRSMWQSIY